MASNKEEIKRDGELMAEDALFRAKYAKEEMCRAEAMTDNPPLMLVAYESDEDTPNHEVNVECSAELGLSIPHLIALVPLIHEEDVLDAFYSAVREMPKHKFGWIFFVVEGYYREMTGENGEVTDYQRGEMEHDYKNNPFSDVRESLIVYGMNWDTDMEITAHAPYTYDDMGVPVFGEEVWVARTDVPEDDECGRMGIALREGIKFMRLAVKANEIHDLMLRGGEDRKKGDK